MNTKFDVAKTVTDEQLMAILNGIKNGVNGLKGRVIPFELIDYYKITSLPIGRLYKIAKEKLTKEDYTLVSRFIEANKNKETSQNNKDIINITYTYYDYTIDEAEKMQILEYMINNNIPIFVSTFRQVAKRYVAGNIQMKKSRKRKVLTLEELKKYRVYDRKLR